MGELTRIQACGEGGPNFRFGGFRDDLVVSFFRIVFMRLFFSFGICLRSL